MKRIDEVLPEVSPRLRTQTDYLFRPAAEARISDQAGVCCRDESLTQQQFKDEADINVLVKRFGLDGLMQRIPPVDPGYYGAAGDLPDLRTVLEVAREAQERFMSLDPKIRRRFNNDPAELWRFVQDPSNHEDAVRLGLLQKVSPAPAPEPQRVVIVGGEGSGSPQPAK